MRGFLICAFLNLYALHWDNSVHLQTQKAALHHLVNHFPYLESMLMQHVNATVS
jgi:hypothetical protein